jgi:hypothetical protein
MEADEQAITDEQRSENAQRAIHKAISENLPEGQRPLRWILSIDCGVGEARSITYWAGGGEDGTDEPTPWEVVGLTSVTDGAMKTLLQSASGP